MSESSDERQKAPRRLNEDSPEESLHKPIRPYNRSKVPRLHWSTGLNQAFENAVKSLGGLERATPKMVLELMNIEGVTKSNIKSHLQLSRLTKKKTGVKETNSSGNEATSTDQDCKNYNEGPVELHISNQRNVKEPPMITKLNPRYKECEENKEDDFSKVTTVKFIDFFDKDLTVNDRVCSYASSSKASSIGVKDVSLDLTLG